MIQDIFSGGQSFSLFPLRVMYSITDATDAKLQAGFTVSTKKFSKATDRNRVKRLMREAYRINKNELKFYLAPKTFYLAVMLVYTGNILPDFNDLNTKMEAVIKRLIKISNEKISTDT